MRIKKVIDQLHIGNALKLSAATAIGQVITYAAAPILSRLFSTEDFSKFALYYAWVVPLAVLSTFRIEFSIPNTPAVHNAFSNARLALKCSFIWTVAISVLIFVFYLIGLEITYIETLIPIGMLAVSIPQVFNFLSTRLQLYKLNALYRITNNLVLNGASLLLGYIFMGPIGLVAGFLIGQCAASILLYFGIYSRKPGLSNSDNNASSAPETSNKLSSFKNYILFNTPQGIIETLQLSGTIWLLNLLFGESNAGLYYLCWRIIQAPITLVSNAIFIVQFNKASSLRLEGLNYVALIRSTSFYLFLISLIGGATLFLFGPPLFAFVFGEEWRSAGEMARYLSPWFVLNFTVSPFSFASIIEKKQRTSFVITTVDLVGKLAGLYVGFLYNDILLGTLLFSITSCLVLIYSLFWYFKLAS
ncbi:MAG: lipopolysaccharide biosynthesis protein [Flavobacteriales bacterium]